MVVDTSAIYALLDRSDANHSKAVDILKKIRAAGDTVVVTDFVVAETHSLILAKFGHALARAWLTGLCWPVEKVIVEDENGPGKSYVHTKTSRFPTRMLQHLQSWNG